MLAAAPSKAQIQVRVDSVPVWWHSIDVGQGVVTTGFKTPAVLKRELESLHLPDLRGKTVLDINTWDGFYAFEAEKRGAASVTALDFYVWAMDLKEHFRYWRECQATGAKPKVYHTMPYFKPEEMPGKIGFDTARELRESRVKTVVADFMETDLEALGSFDVTFFLGTLYHMENPLESVRRLSAVTRELAIIETEAVEIPGNGGRALCEFFEGGELNNDSSNWWAPNAKALAGLCRAAGFRRVDIVVGPPVWARSRLLAAVRSAVKMRQLSDVWRYRAVAHAYK